MTTTLSAHTLCFLNCISASISGLSPSDPARSSEFTHHLDRCFALPLYHLYLRMAERCTIKSTSVPLDRPREVDTSTLFVYKHFLAWCWAWLMDCSGMLHTMFVGGYLLTLTGAQ